jgi:DNA-3-methyladenine glycosylase
MTVQIPVNILPFSFYARETLLVAKDLLGKILVHIVDGERVGGRIVEVEAYLAFEDPASHAFRGPTPRSAIMFGPPGKAYVYFIYGNHYCFNVVAHNGTAGAILVRALEPLFGLNSMKKRRNVEKVVQLTNGPGKLAQALDINKLHNGVDLTSGNLVLLDAPPPSEPIVRSTRIGIHEDKPRLYRFCLKHNIFVSPPHPW